MAASLFLPSLSFNNHHNHRMDHVCLRMHSDHFQKGIISLSACFQNRKCSIKLYMIPCKKIVHSRPFAAARSLGIDVASQGSPVSSGSLAPSNVQRLTASNEMSDYEVQLQELFDEVKTMIVTGNKEEAIDLLEANYEAVKEQMDAGVKGMEEAALLDIIALGYTAIGDLKVAGSLLDKLNEVVDSLKDDEPLLASILIHMGSIYSALGKFEKSKVVYQRVLGILESAYGKDSTTLITPLLGMAKVLGSIGRATKAVEIYHRVITILELCRGPESEDLVVPLLSLGNLLIKEGKVPDAEISFIRILDIYRKLYGEKDGRVGMALCTLAHVKCAKGNAEEAISLYKDALQVIKDSNYMALDDSAMEKMRIDLAELLHVVGRGNEGRELLEECLLITEKFKGKNHPSSVSHLLNLATSHSRSKNFVEAERILRTSLQVMMKTVEPDDQSISFPMLHLAIALYHLKREEEAEPLALEALRIREKAFGKESLPVGEALDCLVSIQMRLGKEDCVLLDLLNRVLRIQEIEFGNESEEVMLTLKKVVYYLDKMGKYDGKLPLQRRLSKLRKIYKQMIQY